VTVKTPANINTHTAKNERFDPRANPQIPWPLVQPEPKTVPNPTNNPATIKIKAGCGLTGKAMCKKYAAAAPPKIRPATKAARHN
jgi:hypothetical protein